VRRGTVIFIAALPVGGLLVALLALLVPVVVPVVVLLGLASLVRLGTTILDRVMVATAAAVGTLCAAGLVLSVWPWGFDPVALGLLGWTGLWALAATTGRRPRLPRPSGADVAFPVAALAGLWSAWPLLNADGVAGRLGWVMIGEDNARHYMWFQAISHAQSYIFLALDDVKDMVVPGSDSYPQGWHLTAAVLDRFAGGPGTGPEAFNHYLGWTILTHCYLLLTVIWVAMVPRRRIVLWQGAIVSVVAGCLVLGGELSGLLVRGYPGESLGLSLCLAGIAVVAIASRQRARRPLREPAWILAATLVGTSFSYYVSLVPLGVIVVVWLWSRRRDLRPAWLSVGLAALWAASLVWLMPYLGSRFVDASAALEIPGNPNPIWVAFALLGGGALGGGLLLGLHRQAPWRWLVGGAASFFLFGLALSFAGQSGYYAHKIWHLPIAIAAALTATLLTYLPVRFADRRSAVRGGASLVAIGCAAVVATGVSPWGPGAFTDPMLGTTPLRVWRSDIFARTVAADVVDKALRSGHPRPGEQTLLVDPDPTTGYLSTIYYSTMTDSTGSAFPLFAGVGIRPAPEQVVLAARQADGPFRILTTSPEMTQAAEEAIAGLDDEDLPEIRVITLR